MIGQTVLDTKHTFILKFWWYIVYYIQLLWYMIFNSYERLWSFGCLISFNETTNRSH